MNFLSRQVEFIFSQTAPAVCLPCKQTDFTNRIIALFRVLLYRVTSKKLLKIENTRSNHFELEFTFSFDPYNYNNVGYMLFVTYKFFLPFLIANIQIYFLVKANTMVSNNCFILYHSSYTKVFSPLSIAFRNS